MNNFVEFSNGILQYKWYIFAVLMSIALLLYVLSARRSFLISKHFNFWRLLKQVHFKKRKQPVVSENTEQSTLIGYNHKKPVLISDSCKHILLCGTTGSGKTVALSNFVSHAIEKNMPCLIVDGKGDVGAGSLLEITTNFCKQHNKKLYVINLSNPNQSDKYNPFAHASPTAVKDMLINMSEWSEEHYKANTERYIQRLTILLQQAEIQLSFQTILQYLSVEQFNSLSSVLLKSEIISKEEHLMNLDISKVCGKISENASARFSTIIESECGQIFAQNGIDIYTAIQENAVILFILNPLLYPELSPAMGRLLLIDSKQAVSKCFNSNLQRAFFIFDELNSYASTTLIDLVNKSRSANITCILSMQSLSDLDFAVDENFKEQVIENCNNYIVLRQNSAKNAEAWANVLGTRETLEMTYQLEQQSLTTNATGLGSAKRVREFLYHPDDIKILQTGKAIFLSKDNNFHCKVDIHKPF